jgi:anaerobic selenocysteine-containing dehydrogenase
MLSNLMMMRGQIGKRGAGCARCAATQRAGRPHHGHRGTPTDAFLDRLEQVFGFARRAITAMTWWHHRRHAGGEGQGLHRPGRQFRDGHAGHAADLQGAAIVRADGAHRHQAESQPPDPRPQSALILPTLGRTEIDLQNGVPQGVTVEDSMSMVHISYGMNKPASPNLLSEIAIVARMAEATLGSARLTGWPTATTTPASATISKRCSTTSTTTTRAWPSRAASI